MEHRVSKCLPCFRMGHADKLLKELTDRRQLADSGHVAAPRRAFEAQRQPKPFYRDTPACGEARFGRGAASFSLRGSARLQMIATF